MADPYAVLGLDRSSATEEAVRARYLELVRRHSPERDPQRFTEIREAYERLRDPETRLRRELFEWWALQPVDGLIEELRKELRSARIPTAVLLSLASYP